MQRDLTSGEGRGNMTLTIRLRVRDKHASELARQARAVNFVWNYCNEVQKKAAQAGRRWLSDVELQRMTSGSGPLLNINADTVSRVCRQYVRSRRQHNRPWLKFRGIRSLGWVPFKGRAISFAETHFIFRSKPVETMDHRLISGSSTFGDSSFNRDSRGRWYLNLVVTNVPKLAPSPQRSVWIDLGLKDLAALSSGEAIANARPFAASGCKLASAQRARKKRRARSVHAKIFNSRKDYLHKISARIAAGHNLIVVGDVSSKRLARTKMAKSVLDAGWADFKDMLRYKAIRHDGVMIEVDERYTTQTCSTCGSLPPSRPKGIAGLGIREWACDVCGAVHSRDVNAARNILRLGLETLAAGADTDRSSHVQPVRAECARPSPELRMWRD